MSIVVYGYDDTERGPAWDRQLIDGCCMECGEVYY